MLLLFKLLSFMHLFLFSLLLNKINSQIFYDDEKYTEFHSGNLNILLSVPHDGLLKPDSITDRASDISNNLKGDYNTRKLGLLIRSKLTSLINDGKKTPFMIFNNLKPI